MLFIYFFFIFFFLVRLIIHVNNSVFQVYLQFGVLNLWQIATFFAPHSSLDGVDHLIRLITSEASSFFFFVVFAPTTELYIQPCTLAVAPECTKRTVDCRYLCFLRLDLVTPLLHLLALL